MKTENQQDKHRFEALKHNEESRGRDEKNATKVAAKETKELRKREGRSKENEITQ
ncbi:MAG TPA: hypothetical protein VFE46_11225 [Pirellulales bacterium]|jgi:hypothetical protein|nr:hypothetical protein [Pirellulales bacterium]